jgi:hypothetical protein
MKNRVKIFEENKLIGGYSLAVREDWSYKIKRVNITEKEKKMYEETFGEEIISYEEFFDWWCKINNYGKYSK